MTDLSAVSSYPSSMKSLEESSHQFSPVEGRSYVFYPNPTAEQQKINEVYRKIVLTLEQDPKKNPHVYKDLAAWVSELNTGVTFPLSDENIKQLQELYATIKENFLKISSPKDAKEALQASDLLEAYNTIFTVSDLQQSLGVARIRITEKPPSQEKAQKVKKSVSEPMQAAADVSKTTILLADYQALEKITQKIQEKARAGGLTLQDVKDLVKEQSLDVEAVPMGKMIDLLYRHRFSGRIAIGKLVTQIATWRYGSSKLVKDVLKTVKFYRQLHIDLWMDIGGELYSFKELFGYDLRTPKTLNESFTRSLTQQSVAKLLEKSGYTALTADVREKTKDTKAQVVCANAYSRNSLFTSEPGTVRAPHQIREKLLEIPSEVPTEEESYAQRSDFSLFAAFGGFEVEETKSPTDSCGHQAALLSFCSDFVNEHRVVCNVSRLAPADVHHYCAPVQGKVLTRAEICEELSLEIAKAKASGSEEKLARLESLKKYFSEEQNKGGSTINIAGSTLESVSTKAISQESGILSTNDRKILVMKHDDGSLSFHILVGASAVNSVGASQHTGAVDVGRSLGDMSFGGKKDEEWVQERTGTLYKRPVMMRFLRGVENQMRKILQRIKRRKQNESASEGQMPAVSSADEAKVGFGPGGSTVISLYLARDYLPEQKIEEFNAVSVREHDKKSETIEIRCRLGDPLATPVTYQTVSLMAELNIPQEGTPKERLEALAKKLQELPDDSPLQKRAIVGTWKSIFSRCNLGNPMWIGLATGDDAHIIQKTIAMLSSL